MADLTIPVIETERLFLRGPKDADMEPLTATMANPEVLRYIPRTRGLTPRQRAERRYRGIEQLWQAQPLEAFGWVVALKASDQFVGWAIAEPMEGTVDGEVAYFLDQPYWGHGYATEATRAMVRYGFEHTDWERIVAAIMLGNSASMRVVERLGFVYERDLDYCELTGGADLDMTNPMTRFYALSRAAFTPGAALYHAPGV
ncbi:MAG TPA: GNAT family N-acetyltransferase [Ktedonobacterales bacterium]